jgi:hypothetical protein
MVMDELQVSLATAQALLQQHKNVRGAIDAHKA